MQTDSKKHDAPTDANNVLADVLFFEKPQERKIDGIIEFKKNGQKYSESKVFSVPCKRCEGCPVYRVDERVIPTAYYCQAGFLFGIFNKAIKENTIPQNCRVTEVRVSKNIR
jgi:hypothetical protein